MKKKAVSGQQSAINGRRSAGSDQPSAFHFPLSPFTLHRTGFTLVELLAVIVIMGILLATVAPSIIGLMRGAALNGATMQVRTALSQARQLAVVRHRTAAVLFPTNANDVQKGFRAILVIVATNAIEDSWEAVGDWQFLPPGVVYSVQTVHQLTNYNPGLMLSSVAEPVPVSMFNYRGRWYDSTIDLYEGWVDQSGVRQARPNGATNRLVIRGLTGSIISERLGDL